MAKETDNRRLARVEREVLQVVAKFIIREMKDDLPGLVTVTRVKMPADLRTAKVYVSLFNPEGEAEASQAQAVKILQKWAVHIQADIESELALRFTPKLTFFFDETIHQVLHVENILHQLNPTKKPKAKESDDE